MFARAMEGASIVRSFAPTSLLTSVPTADEVLKAYVSELGHDFIAYRNHVYRVMNLCAAIAEDCAELEKIAIAAVFHDLGIWTVVRRNEAQVGSWPERCTR
jgi:hypothetical protein